MTSNRISKISEGDKHIFYKAECACSLPNHSHIIEISDSMSDLGILEMTFYSTQVDKDWWKIPDKDHPHALKNMWWAFKRRIVCAFNILFKGYYETEVDFMLQGEEQIRDYINALEEGLAKIKNEKQKTPKSN
jgi:hypothetical protein